jgi:hypothetical protein
MPKVIPIRQRIRNLDQLTPGWDGDEGKVPSVETQALANDLVGRVVNDSWTVGPVVDGSIVFTNKRQTKKIMVAATTIVWALMLLSLSCSAAEIAIPSGSPPTAAEYARDLISAGDRRYQDRFELQERWMREAISAQEEKAKVALAAAEKAVAKAETSSEARFASMNEFRGQLKDQTSTFVTRVEIEALKQQTASFVTRSELLGACFAVGGLVIGVLGLQRRKTQNL